MHSVDGTCRRRARMAGKKELEENKERTKWGDTFSSL